MMRTLTLFLVFLLAMQRTFADDCVCNCCTTTGCAPQSVGSRNVFRCSMCASDKCVEWFYDRCPRSGSPGASQAVCRASYNGTKQLLPSLFIVFGITSMILMIKNKF